MEEEDTWTHPDVATTIRRWKSNDREIKAHDREIIAPYRETVAPYPEIVAHDREIRETRGVSDPHQTVLLECDRGPRRVDFIMEQTADDRRAEIPFRTDVLLLF